MGQMAERAQLQRPTACCCGDELAFAAMEVGRLHHAAAVVDWSPFERLEIIVIMK